MEGLERQPVDLLVLAEFALLPSNRPSKQPEHKCIDPLEASARGLGTSARFWNSLALAVPRKCRKSFSFLLVGNAVRELVCQELPLIVIQSS
jgi:hypothetical protein